MMIYYDIYIIIILLLRYNNNINNILRIIIHNIIFLKSVLHVKHFSPDHQHYE